jgi:hypothetical protein
VILAGVGWEIVATAPVSFALGLIVGFILSDRYRITRRNGNGH